MNFLDKDGTTKVYILVHPWWIQGYVGKQIRVVLPSCAVSCIRAHFPSARDEEHFNFLCFKYPDL